MTSTLNYAETRLSSDNATLLLIDHQAGIMQLVHDYTPAEFRNNVIALAKLGKVYNLPTVITSSYQDGPNGPIIPEIIEMYPDAPIIKRPGQISSWDNPEFVAAVKKIGRKNLIMAGVTTDVCLAFPAMQAAAEGYNVYGVIDASGADSLATQQMAVSRLVRHGVTPVTWLMVAAELQRDWRLPTGQAMGQVFHQHLHNYGMLIDSFSHASKAGAEAKH